MHGPRIKVSKIRGKFDKHENFSVSVSHDPKIVAGTQGDVSSKELDDIFDWVKLNHDHLHALWHEAISEAEFRKRIEKIS